MKKQSYEMGLGFHPNPVYEAANAFLQSAEREYIHQNDASSFWLDVSNWFVVHHLSVIATELFLKSFHVTVLHGPAMSEDGPDDQVFKHAFNSHNAEYEKLPPQVIVALRRHLTSEEYSLLSEISTKEVARGRYPYEDQNGTQSFPIGTKGKELALRWLQLARSMSAFYRVQSSPFDDEAG